ncbi:spindle and kinetochore-associated protein 1-like [Saccostrea echinata]|uniref:spindle and kinetochore-associated protein 1-like n=1 Tax=Saccostrea echinata TaxID=191078 RepID=UPI002A81208C|nr:spindle and kinetochore-associated protein 1-like [Saccostrea echinata]
MELGSLPMLMNHFCEKLEGIHFMIDLKENKRAEEGEEEESTCQELIEHLSEDIDTLSSILVDIKSVLKQRQQKVDEMKALTHSLDISSLQHLMDNIPPHLPKPVKTDPTPLQSCESETSVASSSSNDKENIPNKRSRSRGRKHAKAVYIPALVYITVEEFEEVPKYMKGRLNYNQVNTVIDELNKALSEKYKILGMKRTTLNDVNRKRYERYKEQESKDTKGEHFIVDTDIKEFTNFKLDSVGRSVLTILRHCGRTKEIRGGRLTRYACIEVY